jgi:serpin B
MRICLFLLFLSLAVLLFPAAHASAAPVPASAPKVEAARPDPGKTLEAAGAVNAFAVDFYLRLAGETPENSGFFFSPYSIASALAMVCAGADGETAREMTDVLHLTGLQCPHAAMKDLKDRLDALREDTAQKNKGIFSVANRIWVDEKEELLPSYMNLVRLNYGGGTALLDFRRDARRARAAINDWTAQETRGKIQDLLRAGDVTRDTRLVLTNAVYFNSDWAKAFDKKLTRPEPFRTGRDTTKDVPFMRMTASFLYGEDTDLQFLKMPYKLPGFSLLILLPRANEAFTQMTELEAKLSPRQISDWTAGMNTRSVSLRMPKFRSEGRWPLAVILGKLGMHRAFTRDADFSKMVKEPVDDDGVLHIDSVIHQAFIELDEKGTEAAAATAITMVRTTAIMSPEPSVEFHADRPFIYCLMDDRTGAILFMGRLVL